MIFFESQLTATYSVSQSLVQQILLVTPGGNVLEYSSAQTGHYHSFRRIALWVLAHVRKSLIKVNVLITMGHTYYSSFLCSI